DAVAARGAEDGLALGRLDLLAVEDELDHLRPVLAIGRLNGHGRTALVLGVADGRALAIVSIAERLVALSIRAHRLTVFRPVRSPSSFETAAARPPRMRASSTASW